MGKIEKLCANLNEYCNMRIEKLTTAYKESVKKIIDELCINKDKLSSKDVNLLMNYKFDYDKNPPAIINIYVLKAYVKHINNISTSDFDDIKIFKCKLLFMLENIDLCGGILEVYPNEYVEKICEKEKKCISDFINMSS